MSGLLLVFEGGLLLGIGIPACMIRFNYSVVPVYKNISQ